MNKAATRIKLLTEKVSSPVYQEPASQVIMGLLGERKDDILIYDRCRLLVDHFSIPHSYLGYPFAKLTDVSINLVPRFFRGFNMRFAAMLEAQNK